MPNTDLDFDDAPWMLKLRVPKLKSENAEHWFVRYPKDGDADDDDGDADDDDGESQSYNVYQNEWIVEEGPSWRLYA
jgi:hypothetical protein